jgi:hypothetical protein
MRTFKKIRFLLVNIASFKASRVHKANIRLVLLNSMPGGNDTPVGTALHKHDLRYLEDDLKT